MAETIQQQLRQWLDESSIAVRYGERRQTWREHLADATAQASALLGIADRTRPVHIGALLGNTPDMLTALAAAGLGGYVLCGINNTRRGAALQRDILHADCQILLTDAEGRATKMRLLAVVSLLQRDYALVQGSVLFIALNFMIVNLLVDLAYGLVNPKVRLA